MQKNLLKVGKDLVLKDGGGEEEEVQGSFVAQYFGLWKDSLRSLGLFSVSPSSLP